MLRHDAGHLIRRSVELRCDRFHNFDCAEQDLSKRADLVIEQAARRVANEIGSEPVCIATHIAICVSDDARAHPVGDKDYHECQLLNVAGFHSGEGIKKRQKKEAKKKKQKKEAKKESKKRKRKKRCQ